MKKLIIFILLILGLSCSSNPEPDKIYYNSLKEDLISRPDSLLSILQTVNIDSLNQVQKAHFILADYYTHNLLSLEYFNEESSIQIVRNLEIYKDPYWYSLALYYKAVFLIHRGEFELAMNLFIESLIVAQDYNYYHIEGMIHLACGVLYNLVYLNSSSIEHYNLAVELFLKAGDPKMSNRAYGLQAVVYNEMEDYNTAEEIYLKTKLNALHFNDIDFLKYILRTLIMNSINNDDIIRSNKALFELNEIDSDIPVVGIDYMALSFNSLHRGDIALALKYLSGAQPDSLNSLERLTFFRLKSAVHSELRDFEEAFKYKNIYTHELDSLEKASAWTALIDIESSFQKLQLNLTNEKLKKNRDISIKISLSIILILLIALSIFRLKFIKKKKELETRLAIINDMGDSKQTLLAQLNSQKEKENALKIQIEKTIQFNKDLVNLYYNYSLRPEKFLKQFSELIEKNKISNESFSTLVETINLYYNDFLTKLKSVHPQLTRQDIIFCGLILAKFSPQEISVIMGYKSIDVIYATKYRLKQKMALTNKSFEEYIDHFTNDL